MNNKNELKYLKGGKYFYITLIICLIVFLNAITFLISAFNRLIVQHDEKLSGEICTIVSEKMSNSLLFMTDSALEVSSVLSAQKFDSPEDFYRAYGKAINWNPETHAKILELVEWAKNNTQFIQFSLASFVIDRRWNELEALRNGDIANINFNAVKML